MNEDVQPIAVKLTHGLKATLSAEDARDGIARSVECCLTNTGQYYITIATHWGKNDKPLQTTLVLTQDALEILIGALIDACHNMNQYPILKS